MRINYATKELLDETTIATQDVEFAVRKTKLNFQSQKLATEEYLASKKAELAEAKTTYPLDLQKVCNLIKEIKANEATLATIEQLEKEFKFV